MCVSPYVCVCVCSLNDSEHLRNELLSFSNIKNIFCN